MPRTTPSMPAATVSTICLAVTAIVACGCTGEPVGTPEPVAQEQTQEQSQEQKDREQRAQELLDQWRREDAEQPANPVAPVEPEPPPLIRVVIPAKREFQHTEKITEKHDKFLQSTLYQLSDMNAAPLEWMAYFYADDFPPESVYLTFYSRTEDKYRSYRQLIWLIDDVRVLDDTPEWGRMTYGERLSLTVTPEFFVQLANAKTVEYRVGIQECTLTEANLEAIRDLASRIPLGTNDKYEFVATEPGK